MGDQLKLIQKAGFVNVECLGQTGIHTSEFTGGAHFVGIKK